ncbi:hypothetical protein NEFER03_0505 [Nematocida sp. LUAm3]|nr:hypothetical protein NEFER03_0505 [Nematocida sp. LUAm3]KAI5175472.1 hypothetical protein NEFER02_1378 [Nematocida sp. LUAm2]KAI5178498.1 hypothetical protein NEFER01_1645 [Nematocida sp. LUAm1]
MEKIRRNKFLFRVAIVIISFLLTLDLSHASVHTSGNSASSIDGLSVELSLAEQEEGMPQHNTSSKFVFNTFSENSPYVFSSTNHFLKFSSYDEFKKEYLNMLYIPTNLKYIDVLQSYKVHSYVDEHEKTIYSISLREMHMIVLDMHKSEYPNIILERVGVEDIIYNCPTQCLTGEEAAHYLFEFFNLHNTYVKHAEGYAMRLEDFKYNGDSDETNMSYSPITSAKEFLNMLFVHARFMNLCAENISAHQYILDRVEFDANEKKNLVRYSEFILSCIPEHKYYDCFRFTSTKTRLNETKIDLSSGCSLIKNYNNVKLLYDILFTGDDYLMFFKTLLFGSQNYKVCLSRECIQAKEVHNQFIPNLPDITNAIVLQDQDTSSSSVDIKQTVVFTIIFCGTKGTVKIHAPLTYQEESEYKTFKKAVKEVLLNGKTKIILSFFNPAEPLPLTSSIVENTTESTYNQLEELCFDDSIKTNEQEEKTITTPVSATFNAYFWCACLGAISLPLTSILGVFSVSAMSSVYSVFIFIFCLFALYSINYKENIIQKKIKFRDILLVVMGFIVLYTIILLRISIDTTHPTVRIAQMLFVFGMFIITFFGVIASSLIFKSRKKAKKYSSLRLVVRSGIYLVSILLILLPPIMTLLGYKTDAMILVQSHIMVLSSTLFFIGILLEERQHNDPELQTRRRINLIASGAAIAFFAISLAVCIAAIHICSLNMPFDASTEVTKESSVFYRFFFELFKDIYSQCVKSN